MKHIDFYTRKELLDCLRDAGAIPVNYGISNEALRKELSDLIQDGDAKPIEELE